MMELESIRIFQLYDVVSFWQGHTEHFQKSFIIYINGKVRPVTGHEGPGAE